MNSMPRWLISITDMPDPCQSSISAAACASTSSGRTAGPALKLNTRVACLLPIYLVLFLLGDALDAGELGAFVQVDEAHALSRAAHLANLLDAHAYEHAARGDEHDLVLVAHQHGADELAVAFARLDPDHPLRAAAVARVIGDRRALAETVLGGSQHRLLFAVRDQHRDHALAFGDLHSAHAARLPSHRPHVVFLEAHRLAAVGDQHHVVLALGDRGADQVVAVVELDRDDPFLARIGELRKGRLLDGAEG